MDKKYFLDLACYNQWANEQVIRWAESIDDQKWQQTLISSFPSIFQTVLHIIGAEKIWHDRLSKVKNPEWLPLKFDGDKQTTLIAWRNSSDLLNKFVEQIETEQLHQFLHYKRLNGEEHAQPIYEVLSHVFNHSTYHRGQLVTLFRQVGFMDINSTDLLLYYRL